MPTEPTPEALDLVKDLAQHGTRFDLNPTVDGRRGAGAYIAYIQRIDEEIRRRAQKALSTSPAPSEAEAKIDAWLTYRTSDAQPSEHGAFDAGWDARGIAPTKDGLFERAKAYLESHSEWPTQEYALISELIGLPVAAPVREPESETEWPTGINNIPRFAMLDVWMSLHGAHRSEEFEHFADQHGYAETWARLCAAIRGRVEPESDTREQLVTALMEPRVVKAANGTWKLATAEAEAFADAILAGFTVTEKADRS